jgi:hypothetical protein
MNNKKKMIEILKENGIEIEIGGCGCCGSPWVTFKYNGEIIIDDEYEFFIELDDFRQNDPATDA